TELGINPPLLIAQLVNFSLLLVLMYLFGYKKILAMLDERSRRVKESMDRAEEVKIQAAKAETAFKEKVGEARAESQAIIKQAAQLGETLKEEARQEARKEAQSLLDRSRGEIQKERDESINALRREFADIAILAAEKVIEERLDKESNKKLLDKVLEESGWLKKE
ncbi:MAG: F0F1 ATP synthase subunit B, partial [Dehalococcoidia bacterium]|nr:F0F1 ATP synthase subunit B [Dehalococcoidia bacterium]